MKNKIVLIKEEGLCHTSEVLIFSNERDLKEHFGSRVEIYESHVIVQDVDKCFKTRYELHWAKDYS